MPHRQCCAPLEARITRCRSVLFCWHVPELEWEWVWAKRLVLGEIHTFRIKRKCVHRGKPIPEALINAKEAEVHEVAGTKLSTFGGITRLFDT